MPDLSEHRGGNEHRGALAQGVVNGDQHGTLVLLDGDQGPGVKSSRIKSRARRSRQAMLIVVYFRYEIIPIWNQVMGEPAQADVGLSWQTLQLATVWGDLLRLMPRLKPVLPEDLARLKERLRALHPEGGAERVADFELFFRIGGVLARRSDPLTMGELSAALGVPLSTATRMVDWLVDGGYAERRSDPDDRRIVRVALTETGRELYQTIRAFIRERIEQVLSRFTPEEREQLVVLLRKLVTTLEVVAR